MLHRVLTTIRHLNSHGTGFDSYLANVQRHSLGAGPRMEEARRDFLNTVHNETIGMFR